MKPVRDINPLRLPARRVHCAEGGRGLEITPVSGTVWITQVYDRRDMILTQGQSFMLDRQGLVVVYTLEDAAIVGLWTGIQIKPGETTVLQPALLRVASSDNMELLDPETDEQLGYFNMLTTPEVALVPGTWSCGSASSAGRPSRRWPVRQQSFGSPCSG